MDMNAELDQKIRERNGIDSYIYIVMMFKRKYLVQK
jgi:hypothetical protein